MKALLASLLRRPSAPDPKVVLQAGFEALARGDFAAALTNSERLRRAGSRAAAAFLASFVAGQEAKPAERLGLLREARAVDPDEPAYAIELAQALAESGALAEAVAILDPVMRSAHAAAGDAQLLFKLAGWRFDTGDREAARNDLERVLKLAPDFAEAAANLSEILYRDGEIEEARRVLRPPGTRRVSATTLRRAFTIAAAYRSTAQIDEVRDELRRDLDELEAAPPLLVKPEAEVGRTPFYLAYHGLDDKADLQRIARIVRNGYRAARNARAAGPAGRARVRIGLVSAYFYAHSVGRAFLRLVEGLPRERFEVILYAAPVAGPTPDDALARAFRATADRFEVLAPDVEAAAAAIARAELDLLLYPDLGMDPFTWFLAFWRLAPLQCACAGHPSTTGIDTIDCYLSDALAEPEDGEAHYAERLVRVEDFFLAVADLPAVRTRPRAAGKRYVCTQTVMKLHPDFDKTLGEILARDADGEVLLFGDSVPRINRLVGERLAGTLGSAMERVRLLPRMDYARYLDTVHDAAVILDTPHFGGGNTTMEALALGVPVLTLPGRFLRSRYAYARLRTLEIDECIAADQVDYVDRAVAIANSARLRDDIVARLRERVPARLDAARPVAAFARALAELASGRC
ncbi:MAG: tetratricopeptide repeat protein [Burkholderiales bacterium]|nr:tetratricopeptide repeat protein [Burkholderiales bacterium]